MTKQNALIGGGVDALFGDSGNPNEYDVMVNLDDIEVESQVREEFEDDENDLSDLGRSLRVLQIQAIVVRLNHPGREKPYLLVAGERRYRAAKIEGLTQLRARVKELTDEEAEDVQLAENIHRKNLTQIEEAKKIQRDLKKLGSVEAVLEKHNKNRAWLSKLLSLLDLPDQAKRLVTESISADLEVINTVKTVEKFDPEKAKGLVDVLKVTRGKENARDKANAVRNEVKPSKQKPKPKPDSNNEYIGENTPKWLVEQRLHDAERVKLNGTSNEPEETQDEVFADAKNDYPTLPIRILNAAYLSIYSGNSSSGPDEVFKSQPIAVFDTLSLFDKEVMSNYLQMFYDAGTQAKNVGQAVIQGLRKGHFAETNAGAFALVAFLQGVDSDAKFSLLNIFGSFKDED